MDGTEVTRIGRFLRASPDADAEDVTGRPEWSILANNGAPLAIVEWYAPWRCYVMKAERGTVWSDDCLADVSRFMAARTGEQRAKQPVPAVPAKEYE